MLTPWTSPEFDAHEAVQFVHDRASGLMAIIALHSTALGPAAGGTRFWRYADPSAALTDVLRLSRGMSFKNAMADLPMGGGKAVVLAPADGRKDAALLAAFGDAIEALGGRYVTAEDVGMNEADMAAIGARTAHVAGLPVDRPGAAGGDPGPFTSAGIAMGIEAAVQYALGRAGMEGVTVAIQGTGSVGGGVARLLAARGARLVLADVDAARAQRLAAELGATAVPADRIMDTPCDVFSPNALGGMLDAEGIARLDARIVAGGANNQLKGPGDAERLAARGILYAPDYVINSGGIISVTLEYLARREGRFCPVGEVRERLAGIPRRLEAIWRESDACGLPPARVADRMAMARIGRPEAEPAAPGSAAA